MQEKEREERAKDILRDLYQEGFVETLYNTQSKKHQEQGWTLKSGLWSPWYFNLRPIGNAPKIVSNIAYVMNHLIREEVAGLDQIVGIEMAGVPLVAAIGTASGPGTQLIRYSYTRPLPEKIRTPEELRKKLEGSTELFGWGEKELVEGRFEDGENLCIVDDMVTNFASKLMARMLLEYELQKREIKDCRIEHVAVVLDREMGAEEEARKNNMQLHTLIRFKTYGLDWLKDIMIPEEHQLLTDYQENPSEYISADGREKIEEAIKNAKKFREG